MLEFFESSKIQKTPGVNGRLQYLALPQLTEAPPSEPIKNGVTPSKMPNLIPAPQVQNINRRMSLQVTYATVTPIETRGVPVILDDNLVPLKRNIKNSIDLRMQSFSDKIGSKEELDKRVAKIFPSNHNSSIKNSEAEKLKLNATSKENLEVIEKKQIPDCKKSSGRRIKIISDNFHKVTNIGYSTEFKATLYRCYLCNYRANSVEKFRKHLEEFRHLNNYKKADFCGICKSSIHTSNLLDEFSHMNHHILNKSTTTKTISKCNDEDSSYESSADILSENEPMDIENPKNNKTDDIDNKLYKLFNPENIPELIQNPPNEHLNTQELIDILRTSDDDGDDDATIMNFDNSKLVISSVASLSNNQCDKEENLSRSTSASPALSISSIKLEIDEFRIEESDKKETKVADEDKNERTKSNHAEFDKDTQKEVADCSLISLINETVSKINKNPPKSLEMEDGCKNSNNNSKRLKSTGETSWDESYLSSSEYSAISSEEDWEGENLTVQEIKKNCVKQRKKRSCNLTKPVTYNDDINSKDPIEESLESNIRCSVIKSLEPTSRASDKKKISEKSQIDNVKSDKKKNKNGHSKSHKKCDDLKSIEGPRRSHKKCDGSKNIEGSKSKKCNDLKNIEGSKSKKRDNLKNTQTTEIRSDKGTNNKVTSFFQAFVETLSSSSQILSNNTEKNPCQKSLKRKSTDEITSTDLKYSKVTHIPKTLNLSLPDGYKTLGYLPEIKNLSPTQTKSTPLKMPKNALRKHSEKVLMSWKKTGEIRLNYKYGLAYKNMHQSESLISLFKCMAAKCSFTTNDIQLFINHLILHEEESKKSKELEFHLYCSYCPATFDTPSDDNAAKIVKKLVHHVNDIHRKDIYQCGYCFYRSCDKGNVQIHSIKSHKNKVLIIYQCEDEEILEKIFPNVKERLKRKRNSFVTQLRCKLCEKNFYLLDEFLDHLKDHEMEGEKQKAAVDDMIKILEKCFSANTYGMFQCLYCIYGVDDYSQMREHLVEHPSEFRYFCKRALSPKNEVLKDEFKLPEDYAQHVENTSLMRDEANDVKCAQMLSKKQFSNCNYLQLIDNELNKYITPDL